MGKWGLLLACGVLVSALALVPAAGAHERGVHWSLAKVMRAIDGARLRVEGRAVRVQASTALCSGEGRARRQRGVATWRHFRCRYTTGGGFGRDVEFRVHPLGARRFATSDARWMRG